jgi:hypothetical protein
MKGGKWVWRIPPEMVLYLRGNKDSRDPDERVRELVPLLRRLIIVGFWRGRDELKPEAFKSFFSARFGAQFSAQLYEDFTSAFIGLGTSLYADWLGRLISAAANCDTGFCYDLAEAFRYIHSHNLLDHRGCLALAYLELTRPENYQPVQPQRADAFLHWYGGPINTRSVQRYAEILYAAIRATRASKASSQLELFARAPALSSVHWSRLFRELGLTKEYLPRAPGGKPGKK